MELFLIRHAQSANNAKPESQRVPDPGITEVGRQQAARLADWVRELELTMLITSPFLRTLQTTQHIHEATGLTPLVRSEWHEHGGCYTGFRPGELRGQPGMNRSEIETRFKGYQVHDAIDHQGWWRSQDWETVDQARVRAARVLQQTQEEFADSDERVAIVTHADFKRFFVESFHEDWVDVPANTSVSSLEISPDGARLVQLNRVDHLPVELQTF